MKLLVWFKHNPELILFLIGVILISMRITTSPGTELLMPQNVYLYELSINFIAEDEVELKTYLPEQSYRQKVIEQKFDSGDLNHRIRSSDTGLQSIWDASDIRGNKQILFNAQLVIEAVQFKIPEHIELPEKYDSRLTQYLLPTSYIQSNSEEIIQLSNDLRLGSMSRYDAIERAFRYVIDSLETMPFKGRTDALTALKLGQASCNGKSRLFVALMREQNIPARLIGGIVLDGIDKKTSHQWAELYLNERWVPFDVTNDHFASLPENYLQLYTGDESLFRHSPDIDFDYIFRTGVYKTSPAIYPVISKEPQSFNASAILSSLGLTPVTASIFLLFPLCSLLITFARNVIGVKSFGIFMPMLVAAACLFTGFVIGVTVFTLIVVIAFVFHMLMERYRVLKIPRLAAVITLITGLILMLVYASDSYGFDEQIGIVAVFPVVIIAFTAERINNLVEDRNWQNIVAVVMGTFLLISLCYVCFESLLLKGLFALYPELFLWILALQISIGRWSGIRLSEYIRFSDILKKESTAVLSINARNRDYVYASNNYQDILTANDKLRSKNILSHYKVPVPESIAEFNRIADIKTLPDVIKAESNFVIKPNAGSQGNGILVIRGKDAEGYLDTKGNHHSVTDLMNHTREIISGSYSMNGESDIAYIEPLIFQHPFLQNICNLGLSDIRIIVYKSSIIAAMLRMPTSTSDGKANLHQGAIGIAIDVDSGLTTHARLKGKSILYHPDNGHSLIDLQLPFWSEMCEIAVRCQKAIPLGYIGVDICLDRENGPLVLEVNARPGLEIQNIREQGMRLDLLKIEEVFS